jgi:hypothetical protein
MVARVLCDRRKFDPTLVSIDVSAHRRLCGRRKCACDVCAADVKVDISATSLKSTLVRRTAKKLGCYDGTKLAASILFELNHKLEMSPAKPRV